MVLCFPLIYPWLVTVLTSFWFRTANTSRTRSCKNITKINTSASKTIFLPLYFDHLGDIYEFGCATPKYKKVSIRLHTHISILEKGFKGTGVNQKLPSKHGWSLKITLTIPLMNFVMKHAKYFQKPNSGIGYDVNYYSFCLFRKFNLHYHIEILKYKNN